jgi:CRP-like cAMP-binding protein
MRKWQLLAPVCWPACFPLSGQDLAQMTGTTLFTVSRTLSAWAEAWVIVSGRRRITVRQSHRLVRIAEDLPA